MFVEPWILQLAMEIDQCLQESDLKYGISSSTKPKD